MSRFLFSSFLFLTTALAAADVPVFFEPNLGQAHSSVEWIGHARNGSFYLGNNVAAIHVANRPVRMRLIGARKSVKAEGIDLQPGISSYFHGNDPSKWRSGVPHYAKLRYRDAYPGIDVVYYGTERNIEYDFVVAPGADPSRIELAWEGVDSMHSDPNGDLVLKAGAAQIRQRRPRVLQDGRELDGGYQVLAGNRVRFQISDYDTSKPLLVDPVLEYSSYLGGNAYEYGIGIKVDAKGNIYVAGAGRSPATPDINPFQQSSGVSDDVLVLKLSPAGNQILYYAFIGGDYAEHPESLALDASGSAYVCGMTFSLNYPVKNALQPQYGGGFDDGFVTKLSADGRSLVYSSYLGGGRDDWARSIALDAAGSAYVTGYTSSSDFPVRNATQATNAGGSDAFLIKLTPRGDALVYGTYLGGGTLEASHSVVVDSAGNALIAGITSSDDFPVKNALEGNRKAPPGSGTAFVAKFDAAGSLTFSTFVGTGGLAQQVAVDSAGAVYVAGYTTDPDFPTKNAFQSKYGGGQGDRFITKLSADGKNLIYSTFLGGQDAEYGSGGLIVDAAGSAYLCGFTYSSDFPVKNSLQSFVGATTSFRSDAFVAKLSPSGSTLIFSTLIGGDGPDFAASLDLDANGNIYVTGGTTSTDFPLKNPFQKTYAGGNGDMFVLKLSQDAAPPSPFNFVPGTLPFRFVIGGTVPAPQTAVLSGSVRANLHVGTSDPWIRADLNGTTVTISVNPKDLVPGTYSGTVSVDTATLTVGLTVLAKAPLLSAIAPASVPVNSEELSLTITGTGFTNGAVVKLNNVSPVPTTFIDSSTLRIALAKSLFIQSASFTFTVVNPQSDVSNAVTLTVGAPPPQVSSGGVLNAASYSGGAVSPGEIVTIFGTNFGAVENTRVLFDGVPATLLYVTPGQLSATVPYSVMNRNPSLAGVS